VSFKSNSQSVSVSYAKAVLVVMYGWVMLLCNLYNAFALALQSAIEWMTTAAQPDF
jgi:hypothetical protein